MNVRVRFAPSPTGHLHIGGARTALFNWLFARRQKGTFILRVEDTDLLRSSRAMIEQILDGLRWLGLDWDEGPFFQSERFQVHRALCDRLLQSGHAYRDYSDPGAPPESYRRYREADAGSVVESEEKPFAVRFKVPGQGTISFQDQVFGPVSVDGAELTDFVILRSDGMPTYHLSVVADDLDMQISHVIRGADHLANTSKHVLIYQALGERVPEYAHLPLILGPDRKRLSKRHGATSIAEYRDQGFVAEAMRNYLALLGWSPVHGEEKMTAEKLIASFDLRRVNRADAVFDLKKLEWLNGPFISEKSGSEIDALVLPFLKNCDGWESSWLREDAKSRIRTLDLLKTKVKKLSDFRLEWRAFFCDDFDYDQNACNRFLSFAAEPVKVRLVEGLRYLADAYSRLDPFDLESTETELRQVAARLELETGVFIGAVRIALAGRGVAPGIFDVIVILGRRRTVDRLRRMIEFLK